MDPLALFLSASGRVGPKPFALAVVLVYVAGFASQALLSASVIARSGLWPFALTQAFLTWIWFALHAKRRRDAGAANVGAALGIAILYALSIALLLLVVAFFLGMASQDAAQGEGQPSVAGFLIVFYLIALFSGGADFSAVGIVITIALLVAFAPAIIALAYSIYAGTQPSVAPAAAPPAPAPNPAA